MKELFEEIDRRVHMPENEERYHHLCLHPSEVAGGKEFLENSKRAKCLLEAMEKNNNPHLTYAPQYRCVIQNMTDWLDSNGWAKTGA